MTPTRWIIFALVCIAVIGGLVFTSRSSTPDVSTLQTDKVITDGAIADRQKGSDEQKVVLIEYGDFQCPGCGALYPTLKTFADKYSEQVTFVYRNFPLTSIHPNALAAATVAEAAGQQGKFWEMHDLLFENQDEWSTASADDRATLFETYATRLQLDIAAYEEALQSEDVSEKIRRDQSLGREIGAQSTPTIVINGEIIQQTVWGNDETFEQALRDAIKESGQELPAEQ